MASINSIYGSSINKGVGGLLSGLDTDDLVEKMTMATRTKINRQYQSKQKLLYRQEAYREVSKKLLAFSDKYFSFSSGSKTNILSASFFEAYTFNSSSNYVNITGNAENIKNFSINSISQVASAARYSSTVSGLKKSIDSDYEMMGRISSLVGETMSLSVSGKTYNIKLDNEFIEDNKSLSVEDVVKQLNKQLAKAEGNENHEILKYKVSDDGNKIEFDTSDGRSEKATLVAVSDKIKNVLKMEINTAGETSTGDIDTSDLVRTTEQVLSDSSNYITFEYNGTIKKINLSDATTNGASLETYLQEQLDKAYGDGKIEVKFENNKFEFKLLNDADNKDNTIRITGISNELSRMVGIRSGDGNRLNTEDTIGSMKLEDKDGNLITNYSIEVNGETIDIDANMSINDIMKAIKNKTNLNITYSVTTDKFTVTTKETGENSKIKISGDLADALFGTNIDASGQDTKMNVTINGETMDITRSTANFSIDGMSIELNEKAKDSIETGKPLTFEVTNNIDEVVERVKQFIDDYNEITTLIGTKTKEKPSRKYLPLTPDQRDEMKDKEIEDWDKEAKKGTLFGDSKMTNLLSNLRTSMMGKTDVSDLVLANIGIAPAFMDTSGKLILDEKKFKEKLMENPDEIASLFTGSTSEDNAKQGLAIQIREVLTKNIGAFGTSGILIEEAGLEGGMSSDQNNISKKIKDHDERMETLKKALEAEKQRYWNQFTALEKALSELNAQSSWLTDMMG